MIVYVESPKKSKQKATKKTTEFNKCIGCKPNRKEYIKYVRLFLSLENRNVIYSDREQISGCLRLDLGMGLFGKGHQGTP